MTWISLILFIFSSVALYRIARSGKETKFIYFTATILLVLEFVCPSVFIYNLSPWKGGIPLMGIYTWFYIVLILLLVNIKAKK
ncbi:UNVERIFIED_CONTAM: CHASE2 domain-containing sensor protein [Paenibacillus sp. PvR008]